MTTRDNGVARRPFDTLNINGLADMDFHDADASFPPLQPSRKPSAHNVTNRKKTKKKKRQVDTRVFGGETRDPSEASKFQHAHHQRQQIRGKSFVPPLHGRQTDAMPKTRKGARAAQTDDDESQRASDAENVEPPKKLIYNGKAIKFPKKYSDLLKMCGDFVNTAEKLRIKVGQGRTAVGELQSTIVQLTQELKEGGKIPKNNAMLEALAETFKEKLWRNIKFIQDDEDADNVMARLYNLTFTAAETESFEADHKELWCNTYKPDIITVLNKRRGYLCNRLRDAMKMYHSTANLHDPEKKPRQYLPTMDELAKCMERDIDLDDDHQLDVFAFYHEHLIGTFQCV